MRSYVKSHRLHLRSEFYRSMLAHGIDSTHGSRLPLARHRARSNWMSSAAALVNYDSLPARGICNCYNRGTIVYRSGDGNDRRHAVTFSNRIGRSVR